jgi:hypothetical protein
VYKRILSWLKSIVNLKVEPLVCDRCGTGKESEKFYGPMQVGKCRKEHWRCIPTYIRNSGDPNRVRNYLNSLH